MKRAVTFSAAIVLGITVSIALCQPPGGFGGGRGMGGPGMGGQGMGGQGMGGQGMGGQGQQGRGVGFGPPPNPVMDALDLNKDGSLSAKEIEKAAESLKKLDKNDDGKVTADEMRPDMQRGRRGSGRQSGRTRFGNDRQQGPPNDGMEEHRMGRPQGPGMGGPGQDGPGMGPGMGGPPMGGPPMGGPPMGGPGMGGPGMGGPGMGGPGRGNMMMGPPSPEQFVERAMTFDKDEDGKLSKDELLEMAKQQFQRGPQANENRGRRGGARDGQRSNRPRRPESE